ncbi:hypothetical protein E2C01_036670 [Portunus trituberculatus]|uniref:Uncharacterized protein n=1 Tax=Portunus trituberculatus TaxID=210409 RepID=A0A5B7FC03_PORTR|nr:hypothetical protein [Portunus trituberculatus]
MHLLHTQPSLKIQREMSPGRTPLLMTTPNVLTPSSTFQH